MKIICSILMALGWNAAFAQTPSPMTPDPEMKRVVDAYNTVFMEEMRWLVVFDLVHNRYSDGYVAIDSSALVICGEK